MMLVHADPAAAFEYIQSNPDYRIFQRPFGIIYWRQEKYGPDPSCEAWDPDVPPANRPPDQAVAVGPRIDWNNSFHELGAAALPLHDDGWLDNNNNHIDYMDHFANGQQPPPPWANYTDQVLVDVIPRCQDCQQPQHGDSKHETEICQDVMNRAVSHAIGNTHPLDMDSGMIVIQRDTNGGGNLYVGCFAPLF